jgi:hypothetical protein
MKTVANLFVTYVVERNNYRAFGSIVLPNTSVPRTTPELRTLEDRIAGSYPPEYRVVVVSMQSV